ncbi:MAG: response regulator [Leptolyngbyaceae cyanobacterium bins.302]|nr:response regulator [Leptolyngbyaceae cyanobacterium bins.302]
MANGAILMVEDSDEDFVVFRRIMQELHYPNPLHRVMDGEEALEYLYQRGGYTSPHPAPRPRLILMDLNLPGSDGRELIQLIRQDADLCLIPIVMFTTSSSPKDIETCYGYGANSYILKPIGVEQLKQTIQDFFHFWFRSAVLPGGEW